MKRLMIAALGSGMGKTVITGGLIKCFMKQGLSVAPFKCGPDYIDPVFHSLIAGRPCRNLDLFMQGEPGVLKTFSSEGADIKVIEGVMGYYDGVGGGVEASSYEVACVTDTPVILALDLAKTKGDIIAEINRLLSYRQPSHIAGIILVCCEEKLYSDMRRRIEDGTGLKVYGFLPVTDEAELPSRHLGLVGAREIADLQERFDHIAGLLSVHADIEGLLETAEAPGDLQESDGVKEAEGDLSDRIRCRIAVAHDEAFSFYYEDNLDALREAGAELVFFSPMTEDLPDADGLYIGGGYPELYLSRLSGNRRIAESIRENIRRGMPAVAECGGFLYLQRIMRDEKGSAFPMAGVFDGEGFHTGKLNKRFGYIKVYPSGDSLLFRRDETIPAHEFHYWDCTENGCDLKAEKADGRSWRFGYVSETLYAGFPHFHFGGECRMAERFVKKAAGFAARRLAEKKWMSLAKPLGSLGVFEDVIVRIAELTETADVRIANRSLIVFVGDHGVVSEGVSQSDHKVTTAVAEALGKGRSTVNHPALTADCKVLPVDVGMKDDTPEGVINKKVAGGTGNITKGPAMDKDKCGLAIEAGRECVKRQALDGADIILLGEMGIGNTTACSAIASVMLGLEPDKTVGRGAGLSDEGLKKKIDAVRKAVEINAPDKNDPEEVLQKLGGYEIAALCGACLEGYELGIPILLDGFITDTAALLAVRMKPGVERALIASHHSAEPAAGWLLKEMGLRAMISAGVRLGEGVGAVMALPLLDQALAVYHSGHTFSELGIEPYVPFE